MVFSRYGGVQGSVQDEPVSVAHSMGPKKSTQLAGPLGKPLFNQAAQPFAVLDGWSQQVKQSGHKSIAFHVLLMGDFVACLPIEFGDLRLQLRAHGPPPYTEQDFAD
ncbi:MAG: hypothetical protein HN341_14170 [Verrucomicrobia bacterium]|nr:hypothetical protein [Verrucomicrobiota bacterium]